MKIEVGQIWVHKYRPKLKIEIIEKCIFNNGYTILCLKTLSHDDKNMFIGGVQYYSFPCSVNLEKHFDEYDLENPLEFSYRPSRLLEICNE